MFNINFKRLVCWLIPGLTNQPKYVKWLQSLVFPLIVLYNAFKLNRDKNLYRLRHDSRVFSIENVLNDRFDNSQRRIYITDGFAKQRMYLFTRTEAKPMYLNTVYLWHRTDYADTGVEFLVWVPKALALTSQDLIELTALVNSYRLGSKRFRVYTK